MLDFTGRASDLERNQGFFAPFQGAFRAAM
jgi:hypothetical protein